MKRFVDAIVVSNQELMTDIAHALECCPISGKQYEIQMHDLTGDAFDLARNEKKIRGETKFELRIFVNEPV